jgi:hypothetical protein
MDTLCTILSRLLTPSHLDALDQCCIFYLAKHVLAVDIETQCAVPFSLAALGFADVLIESTSQIETRAVHNAVARPSIAKADVARHCRALSLGVNLSGSNSVSQ